MPVDYSALETLLGASLSELGLVALLLILVILSSRAGSIGEAIGEFMARRFVRPPSSSASDPRSPSSPRSPRSPPTSGS